MVNCKNCFFCKKTNSSIGNEYIRTYDCFANLDGKSNSISKDKIESNCVDFGNLNKAKELFNNQKKYIWKNFGTDKRTSHYKSVKNILLNGADKYLTIYTWSEYQYMFNDPVYAFWHEKSLIHYTDGSFKIHRIRSIKNGKCGRDI